jgi:hypothetical protein
MAELLDHNRLKTVLSCCGAALAGGTTTLEVRSGIRPTASDSSYQRTPIKM